MKIFAIERECFLSLAGGPFQICQGDSGGPLFATTAGRVVQIGIVSYGQSCALPKFPGVYSEVNNAQIRSWITSVSGV